MSLCETVLVFFKKSTLKVMYSIHIGKKSGITHTSLLALELVRGDFHFFLYVLWHFLKKISPLQSASSIL